MNSPKIKIAMGSILMVVACAFFKLGLDERIANRSEVDIRYIPSPDVAKILSFGFKPALADIYWIEAINYFGDQLMRKKKTYEYLKSYVDVILPLDPLFQVFYDWAGTAFIYNGLPITRDEIILSTDYINYGIQKFHEVQRYDRNTIVKGAFNYAIETTNRLHSVPYFKLAAMTFPEERDMLLVASSYAHLEGDSLLASSLKLEFLGQIAFEAQTRDELIYALRILSSSRMNVQAMEFVRALRVKMEKEEDIKKIVEKRLSESQLVRNAKDEVVLPTDPRIENVLNIDLSRTWMPADMLALLSL